jgi:hypothetical protein
LIDILANNFNIRLGYFDNDCLFIIFSLSINHNPTTIITAQLLNIAENNRTRRKY